MRKLENALKECSFVSGMFFYGLRWLEWDGRIYNVYMRISIKQVKHLVVETVDGNKLGKVHELVLDTNGQLVAQYEVRPYVLSREKYLISRDQVVRFEYKKLIVDSGVKPEPAGREETVGQMPNPEPVAMRSEMR